MSAKDKNLSKHAAIKDTGAEKYRIAVVVSKYHDEITSALSRGCVTTLEKYGVKKKNIIVQPVPGAYELPLVAKWVYDKKKVDAVICFGCVIKGDTDHDIYINTAVSNAIINLGIETGAPFIFGVLTPNTLQQAKDRAGGKHGNKGIECAVAAMEMLAIKRNLK